MRALVRLKVKSRVPNKRVVPHFQNTSPAALRHNSLADILAQNLCTMLQQIIFHNKYSTTLLATFHQPVKDGS